MKKCSECARSIQLDFGYSNWTVEGTTIYCSLNLNDAMPYDRWYGKNKEDEFAEICESFVDDEDPVNIDVDFEDGNWRDENPKTRYMGYTNKYVTSEQINQFHE